MKILTIVGARPQFIKAAAVSRVVNSFKGKVEEIIVHTGQHFDTNMSGVFFAEMDIPKPKHNLDIHGVNHGTMTGRMLEGIERIICSEKPDWVLVYGDTNSTLAGALAAAKLQVKVAHVEAGLRSFNMKMPEEINRILTDRISDLLFCPTDIAVKNLKNEGISKGIIRTGDIMADAFFHYRTLASTKKNHQLIVKDSRYALATIHRAENTDNPDTLRAIFQGLEKINEFLPIILPLHPRTRLKLKEFEIKTKIQIIEPLGYLDMINLLDNCSIVLTDSGGLQKEAYLSEKPCATLRPETEWVELIEIGVNVLVGNDAEKLYQTAINFIKKPPHFAKGLYGDGKAAHQIVETMLAF